MTIGLGHYLSVAAILFTLGIFGIFLNRKNVIIILMSIELILLAVNINFQGNAFRAAEPTLVMLSIGETGIYVGNRGSHSDSILAAVNRERQEAATVKLHIF